MNLSLRTYLLVSALAGTSFGQDFSTIVKPEVVGARIADPFQVRKRLGVSPEYDSTTSLENIKIAVLDFGFEGYDPARKQLPASTVVVEHFPDEFVKAGNLGDTNFRKGFAPGNNHGRLMAQVVWATTNFAADGPKFYLLNANGPTMFHRAVHYAVQEKVDVILFCGSFEGIGNFDGKGAINAIVDEAVKAGIIWVNAAGNFGRRAYNGPVKVGPDGFLVFGDGRDFLRFRNNLDENTLTITLNWNSYTDAEDAGTSKDLDLYIQDADGNTIGKSDAVQIPGDGATGENQSKNPRERVVLTDLPASKGRDYLIRIRAMSRNWEDTDRIRVHLSSMKDAPFNDPVTRMETSPVDFVDASAVGEVFPPADHPRVITIGDASSSSSVGPTTDYRVKPDFLIEDSQAVFSNGESSYGSSNAAAYYAGIVCLLKANEPNLTTTHLLKMTTAKPRASSPAPAAPTNSLRRNTPAARTGLLTSNYPRSTSTPIALNRAKSTSVGGIVTVVERFAPGLVVWQAGNGSYSIAIDRSPADLIALFRRFPQDRARVADDYEFYLAVDNSSGSPKLVDYFRRKGANEPAPWQAIGGKQTDWVEVRKQASSTAPLSSRLGTLLAHRVWKTPTKVELRSAIGFTSDVANGSANQGNAGDANPGVSSKQD